jgi:hypothetical protein
MTGVCERRVFELIQGGHTRKNVPLGR